MPFPCPLREECAGPFAQPLRQADQNIADELGFAKMHLLAQWIALHKPDAQGVGKPVDRRHFETEAEITDRGGEGRALIEQSGSLACEASQTIPQGARGLRCAQVLKLGASLRQRIERQVDTIERSIVTATICR